MDKDPSARTRTTSRRAFLLGASTVPLIAQKKRAAQPASVLTIVASDVGAWMLGCYRNREIQTPNIDKLARGGLHFPLAYAASATPAASRATLFTGRTPAQDGFEDSTPPPGFTTELLLSDILAGHGYRCGYAGRWMLGSDDTAQHHFDYWCTLAGGAETYQNPRMSLNGKVVEQNGYTADLITQAATRFLQDQQPDKPFFLVASYLNARWPYQEQPEKDIGLYASTRFDTIGWEPAAPNARASKENLRDIVSSIRKCAAAVTALDDQIPVLLGKLQERGLRDNTLILFVSDSGSLLGRHGLWGDGAASDPINMYEEVIRVPMIWNWPGRVPTEASRPEVVSTYDVLPTLCDALEVPAPQSRNLCGRSFLPLLTGAGMPKKQPWRNLVFAQSQNTAMARDARYKLVTRNGGKGPNELYDVRVDPREKTNQYANPQFVTVSDRLAQGLDAWLRRYK